MAKLRGLPLSHFLPYTPLAAPGLAAGCLRAHVRQQWEPGQVTLLLNL